jgi:hypothetical protein
MVFVICLVYRGGRSVGIVRSRTKGHGVCFVFVCFVWFIALIVFATMYL